MPARRRARPRARDQVVSVDTVTAIERHAALALPALAERRGPGWRFRFSEGHTRRANSVNVLDRQTPIAARLEAWIDEAEAAYRAESLPVIFRETPLCPPGLAPALRARGYAVEGETLVLTRSLADAPERDSAVRIEPAVSEAWLRCLRATTGLSRTRTDTLRRMLGRLAAPAAFAQVEEAGATCAVGLAVGGDGLAGLFDFATLPASRRLGHGRRVAQTLLAWAAARGAHAAYLQVMPENETALALYGGLGFEPVYRYRYHALRGGAHRAGATCA